MTFDEAKRRAAKGAAIREKEMGRGWKLRALNNDDDLFCINPHTGSNYLYRPSEADKASNNWSVVK